METEPHSLLWYPQTPTALFQFALGGSWASGASHSERGTSWAGPEGLPPFSGGSVSPRLLLNLTSSKGWAPGLSSHSPQNT